MKYFQFANAAIRSPGYCDLVSKCTHVVSIYWSTVLRTLQEYSLQMSGARIGFTILHSNMKSGEKDYENRERKDGTADRL